MKRAPFPTLNSANVEVIASGVNRVGGDGATPAAFIDGHDRR